MVSRALDKPVPVELDADVIAVRPQARPRRGGNAAAPPVVERLVVGQPERELGRDQAAIVLDQTADEGGVGELRHGTQASAAGRWTAT